MTIHEHDKMWSDLRKFLKKHKDRDPVCVLAVFAQAAGSIFASMGYDASDREVVYLVMMPFLESIKRTKEVLGERDDAPSRH